MDDATELKLLRRACAVTRVGAWRYDLLSDRVDWSAVTCDLFGIPRDAALSLEMILRHFNHGSQKLLREAMTRCRETGESYEIVVQCRDTAGRWF